MGDGGWARVGVVVRMYVLLALVLGGHSPPVLQGLHTSNGGHTG